jgi:hypothetical protein
MEGDVAQLKLATIDDIFVVYQIIYQSFALAVIYHYIAIHLVLKILLNIYEILLKYSIVIIINYQ